MFNTSTVYSHLSVQACYRDHVPISRAPWCQKAHGRHGCCRGLRTQGRGWNPGLATGTADSATAATAPLVLPAFSSSFSIGWTHFPTKVRDNLPFSNRQSLRWNVWLKSLCYKNTIFERLPVRQLTQYLQSPDRLEISIWPLDRNWLLELALQQYVPLLSLRIHGKWCFSH